MNFYSENIINNIIDNTELENVIDELNDFKATTRYLFLKYAGTSLNPTYTNFLASNEKSKFVFYCLDNDFDITNCPTIMVYNSNTNSETNEIIYYILLICTKHKFKGMGYAKKLLDGFVEHVKQKTEKYGDNKKVTIALSSVEEAVTFYEEYGFKWTKKSLRDHKTLLQYEKYEETKEYFIMELVIK